MPVNKSALIRYKTIDKCLQNRRRKWTLDDLVAACSDAVYEYEGVARGISKRTVQLDIQNMRSEKLGYSAPIVVTDKKYYSYEDRNYSITNIPLSQQDMRTLNEVLGVLRQFRGFGYFSELSAMVTRLEDNIHARQYNTPSYIDFEKNELLRGLQYVDQLHKAIIARQVLTITYQSFKASGPRDLIFYPYLLKEYRNRWFVIGVQRKMKDVKTLALDRIEGLAIAEGLEYKPPPFDINDFFSDVLGVTKMMNQRPQMIVMHIIKPHAPYLKTKPMHPSQRVLREDEEGMIFSIQVVWNFELEREILGFGEFMRVLSPRRLVNKIKARQQEAAARYVDEEW